MIHRFVKSFKSESFSLHAFFLTTDPLFTRSLIDFLIVSIQTGFGNQVLLLDPLLLPSMEALLGRMVTAPSATSSRSWMGELLAPQLSEPTNTK